MDLDFSRILKKRFNKFTRIGINNLNEWENKINKSTPLILAGNHSSWYDAVLPVVISFSDYKFDAYAMMEDLQIIKYKFFSKIGCFSINLKNSKSAAISLRYTINLLNNKKRVLWIYPQGKIVNQEIRPIVCSKGISQIISSLEKSIFIPFAIRIDYNENEYPDIIIKFGNPIFFNKSDNFTKDKIMDIISESINLESDKLKSIVLFENNK